MINVQILETQRQALTTSVKNILMLGGIGSGKSATGALWVIKNLNDYPNSSGMICANTHQQLINASVATLTKYLDEYHIPYHAVLGGSNKRIEIGKTTIYLYSLERPDNIRGPEVGWVWIDEVAFATEYAYKVVKGRLRDKRGSLQTLLTSSPNGFNWLYHLFRKFSKNHKLIKCKTKDNVFLPEGYYEELIELYGGIDSPMALQELEAEWVNMNGNSVYWGLKRDKQLIDIEYHPLYPIYCGVDFNIDNMNAVLLQYINGKAYVLEQVTLTHQNANTFSLSKKILELQGKYGSSFIIIPDSTGSARKTSAQASDHEILRQAGLRVEHFRNPLIRSRQNNICRLLQSDSLFINKSCEDLYAELESLSARDKEGDVAHASVCLGYVLWYLNPLRKQYESEVVDNW